MPDGLFERWIRSAAAIVKPRGGLAVIARPQSLEPILAALGGRFGKVEILPVHPRARRAGDPHRRARGARLARPGCRCCRRYPARGRRRRLFGARRRHQQRPGLAFRRLRRLRRSRHCADAANAYMQLTTSPETPALRRFLNRLLPKSMRSDAVTIPVIRLHGTIMSGGGQFRPTPVARLDRRPDREGLRLSTMHRPSPSRSIRRAARRCSRG